MGISSYFHMCDTNRLSWPWNHNYEDAISVKCLLNTYHQVGLDHDSESVIFSMSVKIITN